MQGRTSSRSSFRRGEKGGEGQDWLEGRVSVRLRSEVVERGHGGGGERRERGGEKRQGEEDADVRGDGPGACGWRSCPLW